MQQHRAQRWQDTIERYILNQRFVVMSFPFMSFHVRRGEDPSIFRALLQQKSNLFHPQPFPYSVLFIFLFIFGHFKVKVSQELQGHTVCNHVIFLFKKFRKMLGVIPKKKKNT